MSLSRALPRPLAALAVLVAALGLLLVGPSAARAEGARARLTAGQAAVVLDLVDDRCGDTWCEGDDAFDVRRSSCAPAERSCTLRLRIAPYTDGPLLWQRVSGQVHGFVRSRQMVTTSGGGAPALTPAFTTAVDQLIAQVEAEVAGRGAS